MTARLLFLDDAVQKGCPRKGMRDLVAVGGISVPVEHAKLLNDRIEQICSTFGIPYGEPFKWSPHKDHWFRKGLTREKKGEFFAEVFDAASTCDAQALATVCDPAARPMSGASDAELGSLLGVLERFELSLGAGQSGMVIVDRPAGSKSDEEAYLLRCLDLIEGGSIYARFDKLACPIVSMPFRVSRLLQTADLVVSISTAHIAGHKPAAAHFPNIRPLLRSDKSRVGGVGIKLHPDFKYANLYHWLLGDTHFVQGSVGVPMPLPNRPYRTGADAY